MDMIAEACSNFAFALYKEAGVPVSPLPVHCTLSLLGLATPTPTTTPMGLSGEPRTLRAAYRGFLATLQAALHVATRVYTQRGCKLRPEFVSQAEADFHAGVVELLPEHGREWDPVGVADHVNRWVREATAGRVDQVLQPATLTADSQLLVVSAIYLKAKWMNPFNTHFTAMEDFKVGVGEAEWVKVPMMHTKAEYRCAECPELRAKLIEMEYKGGALSLVVVLPDRPDGLHPLETRLTHKGFTQAMATLQHREVCLAMPKFRVEVTCNLTPALRKMGVSALLSPPGTPLPLMMEWPQPLVLAAVVQRSFMTVDEEGTEAGAATASTGCVGAAQQQPMVFRADHPFFYALIERSTSTPLFLGRYCGP